jgi:hypothetical protein
MREMLYHGDIIKKFTGVRRFGGSWEMFSFSNSIFRKKKNK